MKRYKVYCKEFDAMIAENAWGSYPPEEVKKHRRLANIDYDIVESNTDICLAYPGRCYRALRDGETGIDQVEI